MAEHWSNQGWNITFIRLPNDWEISRVTAFFNLLATLEVYRKGLIDYGGMDISSGAYKVNEA